MLRPSRGSSSGSAGSWGRAGQRQGGSLHHGGLVAGALSEDRWVSFWVSGEVAAVGEVSNDFAGFRDLKNGLGTF